jgi:endoglucanase
MENAMKNLIKKLVETTAPSGYEANLRPVIEEALKGSVDDIRVDGLGNLIVRKGPVKEGAATIMLAAHMDEIGLMVMRMVSLALQKSAVSTHDILPGHVSAS